MIPANDHCWLVCGAELLVDEHCQPLSVSPSSLNGFTAELLYMGRSSHFGADAGYWLAILEQPSPQPRGQWMALRACLSSLSAEQFAWAGRAVQLGHWWQNHQFCSRCAHVLSGPSQDERDRLEFVRFCPHCNMHYYPRISPCIITLVTREEHCLLAYHQRSKRPMFTTLAGFIEAGERAEQSVRREVAEEVGVVVGQVRYANSQSWPFPGQLMLGFYAEYQEGEITPEVAEIREAHWYHYEALPEIPSPGTIARQLIDGFVAHRQALTTTLNNPKGDSHDI